MNTTTSLPHPPITHALSVDDIRWDNTATIAMDDLMVEALLDAEAYRAVAQEALHALARLTAQHRRLVEVHRHLCQQLREAR